MLRCFELKTLNISLDQRINSYRLHASADNKDRSKNWQVCSENTVNHADSALSPINTWNVMKLTRFIDMIFL